MTKILNFKLPKQKKLGFIHMGLFRSLEYSIFEFVSDFDLPAKAHRRCRARGVCNSEQAYFQIRTLLQAWQAGIRISNL